MKIATYMHIHKKYNLLNLFGFKKKKKKKVKITWRKQRFLLLLVLTRKLLIIKKIKRLIQALQVIELGKMK